MLFQRIKFLTIHLIYFRCWMLAVLLDAFTPNAVDFTPLQELIDVLLQKSNKRNKVVQ